MKEKRSAFLFPLHEPKFAFGNHLVASFNKFLPQYEIFIVFSNGEESGLFSTTYNQLTYKSIVCPYPSDSGIINKKKFFGVQQIIDTTDYEFIAVIDSEGMITKSAEVDLRFETYYKKKTLFATYTFDNDFINKVIQSPFKFFSYSEQEQLKDILDSGRLYYWFNDIPIYKRDVFKRFARHIKLKEKFDTLTWFDFDYLLYSYYCLLHEDFELKVIGKQHLAISFMESQNQMNLFSFIKGVYQIGPCWIKKQTFLYPYAFMTFHNDRLERTNNFIGVIKSKLKTLIKGSWIYSRYADNQS